MSSEAEDPDELDDSTDAELDDESTCDAKNVGGLTSQCKIDKDTESKSFRNRSKCTAGSAAGI